MRFLCSNLAITWNQNGIVIADRIAKLHSLESVVEFELDVRKLQEIRVLCIQSAKFELNDVTWKIQACKDGERDNSVLHMSLVSIFEGDSAAWSCEANATFTLLSIDGENSIVLSFDYYNFNKDESVCTIDDFIEWDNFFEKHVHEDRAIFEIAIKAKTPKRAGKLDESFAKFDVRIKNVNQLGSAYSNELIVRGIRWKVRTIKSDEYLGVFLFANGDDMGIDVYWNASATFHLISPTTNQTVSRSFSKISFDWTKLSYGFSKFIKWIDFMDPNKKLIVNNHAIIKVELSVSEPIKIV